MNNSNIRVPLIQNIQDLNQVTREVHAPLVMKPNGLWYAFFVPAVCALMFGIVCFTYEIMTGIGTWGNNNAVGWAFAIVNFVFWIGIGHAGTFISAVLLLFRQRWRNSINRAAETMTIFAVMCAGIFPIVHLGRPWFAHWFLPYPNDRQLFVNFNSPLTWDVFAISTYASVSLVFWYLGQLPDWAMLRDYARTKVRKVVYSFLSLGWRGSSKEWERHETVSLVLAGLSTPLVVSVHSIVGTDFATSLLPGWHATIFPPYFVAGAVFSGFGMVMTIMIIVRKIYDFEKYITMYHFEQMAKIIILTGSLVGLAYATEFFIAWYSANMFEQFTFINRAFGPYAWAYWIMVTCNVVSPQLLWFRRIRTHIGSLFVLSLFVNVGMWFERFVIVVTSLHASHLPSSWGMYSPTWVEAGQMIGSFGLFFTLFFLFLRFGPYVAAAEVKVLAAEQIQGNNSH